MQESLLSKLLHCPNDYFSSWTGGIVKLAFLTDKAKKCSTYAAVFGKPKQPMWSANTLCWTEKAADPNHHIKISSYTAHNDTT